MPAVNIEDIRFSYKPTLEVLNVKNLRLENGELVFLYGPSGCGKTTLLSLIAGILQPDSGSVQVLDQDLAQMKGYERDRMRGESIGYIFQAFNLVPYLNVEQNILLPSMFGRKLSSNFSDVSEEVHFISDSLKIRHLLGRNVLDLSIGQQQRVAAARAFFGSPGLILADEPTSALDADARAGFLELLFNLAKKEKSAVLFVSHDRSLAKMFDRELSLPELNQVKSEVSQ